MPKPVMRALGPTPESWRTCGEPMVPPLRKRSVFQIKLIAGDVRNDNLLGRINSIHLGPRARRKRHAPRDRRPRRRRVPVHLRDLVPREHHEIAPRKRRDVPEVRVGAAAVRGVDDRGDERHADVRPVRGVERVWEAHRDHGGYPVRELRELEVAVARVDGPARAVRVGVVCDRHRGGVGVRHRGEVLCL